MPKLDGPAPQGEIGMVILCDDARREIVGKDILIGVYTSDVIVPQIPAQMRFSIWMEYKPATSGNHTIDARISYGGVKLLEMRADIDIPKAEGPVGVALPNFQLNAGVPGDLVAEASVNGGPFRQIKKATLRTGVVSGWPPIAPSASPPPS